MKCVKLGTEVVRVTEKKAETLVAKGWKYAPKNEWKASGMKYQKRTVESRAIIQGVLSIIQGSAFDFAFNLFLYQEKCEALWIPTEQEI